MNVHTFTFIRIKGQASLQNKFVISTMQIVILVAILSYKFIIYHLYGYLLDHKFIHVQTAHSGLLYNVNTIMILPEIFSRIIAEIFALNME